MTDTPGLNREIFVCQANVDGGRRDLVSIVDHEWVSEHGLCAEAILGSLQPAAAGDHGIAPERFNPNPAFVQLLQQVIANHIVTSPGVRRRGPAAARRVRVPPRRAHPAAGRPGAPEDVIGAVAVRDGWLVPGSYQHNPNHQLFTKDGFFVLPPEMKTALKDEARARCARHE